MERFVRRMEWFEQFIHQSLSQRTVILCLSVLFLITLGIRLYYAFQTPYLSDDGSYFHLRQIEHIRETGLPLYNDPLSYGGRRYLFPPLYHYILAAISFIIPLSFVIKIIPNLFASSLVIIVYLCSLELTKKREYALFSAVVAAFIPIYGAETFNTLEPRTLTIPLSFFMLYLFFHLGQKLQEHNTEKTINDHEQHKQAKRFIAWYVVLVVLFTLIHPSLLFLVIGLVVFYFIASLENLKTVREERELILFSLLLPLWFYFLIYKDALLTSGFSVIRQNLPQQIIDKVFHPVSILDGVRAMGVIPFLAGIYITYLYIFKKKDKFLYLLFSLLFTIIILLWLKLISVTLGLVYISVSLILFFGEAYKLFMDYLDRTKLQRWKGLFVFLIFTFFIFTSLLPMFDLMQKKLSITINVDDVGALIFLRENTREDQKILAPVGEGHYITYFAQRKNVADTNFLQIKDAPQILENIYAVFSTRSKIVATEFMDDLDARFIYLSKQSQESLQLEELATDDESCFPLMLLYNNVKVYKSRCS